MSLQPEHLFVILRFLLEPTIKLVDPGF